MFNFFRKRSNSCPARLIRKLGENNQFVHTIKKVHNHMLDPRDAEVTESREKIKRIAKSSEESTRLIVAKSLEGVSVESMAQMPSYKSQAETVRRQRKGINKQPSAPKSLLELEIPDDVAKTSDGEPFVLYDSGPDEKNRMIILGTQRNLDILADCEVIYMDGTFDSCPQLFSQLYVILGK